MMMFSMNDMVPQNHMLRLIDRAIDWNFIYDLVEEKYCPDNGRPSMDPVMLIKIPFIQYLYGIKSMRQTMKEIEVNVAYRWFLGLDMLDPVPHFSTFGKNYTRRFKDTDLFEQIFSKIDLYPIPRYNGECHGDVPKWLKGPHSKCGRPGNRCEGSNPSISVS